VEKKTATEPILTNTFVSERTGTKIAAEAKKRSEQNHNEKLFRIVSEPKNAVGAENSVC